MLIKGTYEQSMEYGMVIRHPQLSLNFPSTLNTVCQFSGSVFHLLDAAILHKQLQHLSLIYTILHANKGRDLGKAKGHQDEGRSGDSVCVNYSMAGT